MVKETQNKFQREKYYVAKTRKINKISAAKYRGQTEGWAEIRTQQCHQQDNVQGQRVITDHMHCKHAQGGVPVRVGVCVCVCVCVCVFVWGVFACRECG